MWRKEGKEEREEECLLPIGQQKKGPWILFYKRRLGSYAIQDLGNLRAGVIYTTPLVDEALNGKGKNDESTNKRSNDSRNLMCNKKLHKISTTSQNESQSKRSKIRVEYFYSVVSFH